MKATSENRKTSLPQNNDLFTQLCNRELLNWPGLKKLAVDLFPLVTKIRIDQMIYDKVELKAQTLLNHY